MPLNPTINFAVGDSFKKKREDMMPFLTSRFEDSLKFPNSLSRRFLILKVGANPVKS